MPKAKRKSAKKRKKGSGEETLITVELLDEPEYQKYVKGQEKRIKELERELLGDNMSSPPEKDY
jgi:hypothetical protein